MTIIGDRVELQLLTTLRCNLSCSYCSMAVGDVIQKDAPPPEYSLDQLQTFIDTHLSPADHPREIYVTFYGGEPTLNAPFITQVMQRFPLLRYQLQTNGTLLDNLPDFILSRLSNILVSVDGGQTITDKYRGRGIYKQIIKNIQTIRAKTPATITARVTYSDPTTTFEELDELTQFADYVYWQFVSDAQYQDPSLRYDTLNKLVDKFFSSSSIYPFVPLMGIVRNKLFPNRAKEMYNGYSMCRAETHLINVMPDGTIYPCPDLTYDHSLCMGSVKDNTLTDNPFQSTPSNLACNTCEEFSWCRTNCRKNLGIAVTDKEYAKAVTEPICDLIRYIGKRIDEHNPAEWFAKLPVKEREKLLEASIYQYVEVLP